MKNHGSTKPANLIAGEFPRISRVVTIAQGEKLLTGAVLGEITVNNKYKLCTSNASDGSEIPEAILAEDVDSTLEDKQAAVYFSGEFNQLALQLGKGVTVESIKNTLRDKTIFLTTNQEA